MCSNESNEHNKYLYVGGGGGGGGDSIFHTL